MPYAVRPRSRALLLVTVAALLLGAAPVSAAPEVAASAATVPAASALPGASSTLEHACPDGRFARGRFSDVGGGDLGRTVDCLAWYRITLGIGGGRFDPDGTVTRGQMARFVFRFLEHTVEAAGGRMPLYDGRSRFSDVSSGAGNAAAINVLSSPQAERLFGRRIVSGYGDGRFGPDEPVTREQMGTFLARTFDGIATYVGGTYTRGSCRFVDSAAIATTHRDNVHLMCEAGVSLGYPDGTYRPAQPVTRGQMARFLMRLQDLLVDARWSQTPDPV